MEPMELALPSIVKDGFGMKAKTFITCNTKSKACYIDSSFNFFYISCYLAIVSIDDEKAATV